MHARTPEDAEPAGEPVPDYAAVFDSLLPFAVLLRADGRVLRASATALQLGATTLDAVRDQPFSSTPWWRDSAEKQGQLHTAIDLAAAGETVRYEVDVQRDGGEPLVLELSLKPVRGEAGAIAFLIVEGQDISARRDAEATLRNSERHFRQMFEHAAIGQALIDLDGHWVAVNRALCELLGYSRMELLGGAHFASLNVVEDPTPDLGLLGKLITGDISSYRLEKRYRRKNGSLVPVQIDTVLMADDAGTPMYFLCQMHDISARLSSTPADDLDAQWRRRIESALQDSRLELHAQRIEALGTPAPPSFEVLVRLREAESLVAPGEFLPVAERLGLSRRIDRHVTAAALDGLQPLLARESSGCGYLSINLSAATLADESFAGFVAQELERRALPAAWLRFEVNESAVLVDRAASQRFFAAIRAVGCKILIDNFGRHFEGFDFVHGLSADGLKIDAVHTRKLAEDELSRAFVQSVCRSARQARREVIAEGVETADSAALMQSLGASHVQGHLLHVAEPLDAAMG